MAVSPAADRSALAGDGIAMFLPPGIADYPASLALAKTPVSVGPLPADWPIAPKFSRKAGKTFVSVTVPEGSDLYGTGEVTGPLRRNDRSIELWNTDNFGYADKQAAGRRLYQSHPWVLGVRKDGSAFGLLFDSTWRAELRTGRKIKLSSDGPPMPVIVVDRDSPQAVMRGLAELTGTMPLPPRWALGYQQSRWSYYPDSEALRIADEFRKRKIPADVLWMDIDYMDGFRVFTFSPEHFPDPKRFNADLRARGFHSVWMIDPGVKSEPGYGVYDSGQARDVWVKDAKGKDYEGEVWPGMTKYPDFTRPDTRRWWADLYRDFMAQGVDGVWNDMNEPAVFNVPGHTMPADNQHRGGGDMAAGPHLQYHNVYGMLMVQATREGIEAANPERRPFVLTRANFLGGHRYAATWTGDNVSTWEHLKLSIPMSINLGLSGQPFSGPDIGGFGGEATPDLWGHWIALGAFYPFSRAHAMKDTGRKEPWAFGPEVEKAARIAIERRYRLLPYLYTLFRDSSIDGLPVMRPMFFADPRDADLRREEQAFLLGEDLLVVPKWARAPKLPKGVWRKISLVEGDGKDAYQAELKLRGGAILPLGKVVQNTGEESLGPLTLLISLDEKGEARGRLYEDAGDGYGYRQGDYLLTTYRAESRDGLVRVDIEGAEGKRARPSREIVVQVTTDEGVFTAKGDESAGISVSLQPPVL
ncbi:TIM-barrel domain-containing protein [Luteimonas galliterrae]|nr:TIM-barrel domain-containing protein [Luteimonas galliterrae]